MSRGVVGVLLAGGLSRRMGGGDKSLRPLGRRTILDRVIERLSPQVDRLVLNANGDPARFAATRLPVVQDSVQGFVGPLAGVLAGMDWAAENAPKAPYVVTVATDAPFLPRDLVDRLLESGSELACASSKGQAHPVIGLWAVRLRDDLRRALAEEGIRKVDVWTARHGLATVEFPADAVDPFMNVNTPEDLSAAEKLIAAGKDG
jgi:molybdopterin-guanine dinucleotide biosynthesis protein A